jgi:hypothetical protein
MLKSFSIIAVFTVFNSFASVEFDKNQELNGVNLSSAKENEIRTYVGSTERILSQPIDSVKNGLTNFTERCNNEFKGKREFTDSSHNCKLHDESIIESFLVNDLRKMDYFKEISEVFLVGSQIYNRGSFRHYDLVSVTNEMNNKNQKMVTIRVRMLNDKEVKLYTDPKFSRDSYFENSMTTYTLTELAPKKTRLQYHHEASTRHWLLNKEILVPQVFASISKSINDLVKTVEVQSPSGNRDLASKK